ncbi:MAG: adenosylcobinamide-phosphate synthase CbiB [Ramlibacter sp.]
MILAAALLFAFLLDHAFGEPPARLHPVVWMGRYLGWIGSRIAPREVLRSPDWRSFWAGAMAWYGGAVIFTLAAYLLQLFLLRGDPWVAALVLGALLKPMLAWRMLRGEVQAVEGALAESLASGRRRLGLLVSREVMQLQEGEVRESAIESLAENLNDSVVAPVFWFVVAGLPGAAIYRFANTADAMWGYHGFRAGLDWEWAGKWAARIDDALSWLPARLTALLLALVAGGLSLQQVRSEAAHTPSPNSGWPMAAMALALGVRLRKPGVYALNEEAREPLAADTGRGLTLAARAVGVLLALATLALWLLPSWELA